VILSNIIFLIIFFAVFDSSPLTVWKKCSFKYLYLPFYCQIFNDQSGFVIVPNFMKMGQTVAEMAFCDFQDGGRLHLGFSKIWKF